MGRAFLFGDDVDTDQIIPAQFVTTADPGKLGEHCMEGADPSFADRVEPGDVLVAGTNFGCGSSREHAALAIQGTGVEAVVAESFARIFFRNAINVGLPVLNVPDATERISDGDDLAVDPDTGVIENETTGDRIEAQGLPEFVQEIVDAGGLVEYGRRIADDEGVVRNGPE